MCDAVLPVLPSIFAGRICNCTPRSGAPSTKRGGPANQFVIVHESIKPNSGRLYPRHYWVVKRVAGGQDAFDGHQRLAQTIFEHRREIDGVSAISFGAAFSSI